MTKLKTNWCSTDVVLQIASAKWSTAILNALTQGQHRPAELSRLLTGINPKILTERLRTLEKWGLVERKEYKEIPPRVEYSLSDRGWELLHALEPLRVLGERWYKIEPLFALHHIKEQCPHCLSNAQVKTDDIEYPQRISEIDESIKYIENDDTSTNTTTKIYLVGAGPGASDLISLRGAKILKQVSVVLYSSMLEPEAVLVHCADNAQLINTDGLSLHEQREYYIDAKEQGRQVARLYSGDPTVFGYIAEQIETLNGLNIDYEIIPGISMFSASAARVGCSLTQLRVAESVIITNIAARAVNQAIRSEDLKKIENLSAHKTTMCIYVWGEYLDETITALSKHYLPQTPVNLIYRPQQVGERIHMSKLGSILDEINLKDWQGTIMMLVGNTLAK